jgi:UDP-glucose 4-epimerase
MKILVTGGAGFIGSYLVDSLLGAGNQVTVLDDMSTGTYENIKPFIDNPKFTFILDTILNDAIVRDLVKDSDEVYHLAAAVGVKYVMENPVNTIRTNIGGTEIILRYCSEYNKKVLLASTSEVYGKGMSIKKDGTGLDEDDDSIFGSTKIRRWSYATSKALDEFLGLAYHSEKNLPVVIVRFFNTVGPRQLGDYGMVIPTFVNRALMGDPIPVFGDGSQMRSFTYVEDVVEGIIKLMDHDEAVGHVFNIGNSNEITIKDLAELIVEKTKSNSKVQYIPFDKAYGYGFEDMKRRKPNIAKLANLTGFAPTVSIDEILDKVIAHLRK